MTIGALDAYFLAVYIPICHHPFAQQNVYKSLWKTIFTAVTMLTM
jgi:hypothetical protein